MSYLKQIEYFILNNVYAGRAYWHTLEPVISVMTIEQQKVYLKILQETKLQGQTEGLSKGCQIGRKRRIV